MLFIPRIFDPQNNGQNTKTRLRRAKCARARTRAFRGVEVYWKTSGNVFERGRDILEGTQKHVEEEGTSILKVKAYWKRHIGR